MIKLFYTGATSFNVAQTLPSKSLGGYISNTTVPNGVSNSLFSSLSLAELFDKKKNIEYIGLGLYLFSFENEKNYEKINLNFELTLNEENEKEIEEFKDLFEYKISLGPISGDSVNGYYIESIQSGAKPYYVLSDFQVLNFDKKLVFENISLKEGGVGLWLSRIFNPKKFQDYFNFDSAFWETNDKIPNLDFNIDLKINFEEIEETEDNN